MSTPRYRSEPPSLSGSAISVSNAMTPSRPGRKSLAGALIGANRTACDVRGGPPGRAAATRLGDGDELREERARRRCVEPVVEALPRAVLVAGGRHGEDRGRGEPRAARVAEADAAGVLREAKLRVGRVRDALDGDAANAVEDERPVEVAVADVRELCRPECR